MRCKMCNKVTQEKETTYKLTDYSPIWEMGRKKGVKILGEKPVCRMCYNPPFNPPFNGCFNGCFNGSLSYFFKTSVFPFS